MVVTAQKCRRSCHFGHNGIGDTTSGVSRSCLAEKPSSEPMARVSTHDDHAAKQRNDAWGIRVCGAEKSLSCYQFKQLFNVCSRVLQGLFEGLSKVVQRAFKGCSRVWKASRLVSHVSMVLTICLACRLADMTVSPTCKAY